jgi:DNA-binding transcriptional ArsR family regulator
VDETTRRRYDARARIIKAMGHGTRLYLVDELSRGERCVCELQALVGADMSTVSKHLAVLREAGIVRDEKRGNQVFYSLRCPCVLNFFACVESVLSNAASQSGALVG